MPTSKDPPAVRLQWSDPVDVVDVLISERELLCELLARLDEPRWSTQTECPAWTVKGVALYLLCDDLSLLARQRDSEPPSLLTEPSLPSWERAPPAVLDRFNERWVHASTFLSPTLLVELLRQTGAWTHAWYASVDPEARGEEVPLFGRGPAPYWAITAREYLERWVHHLQIRRALQLDPGRVGQPPFSTRAYDTIARALPTLLTVVAPSADASVAVALGDAAWTFTRSDSSGWTRHSGRLDSATVALSVDAAVAATVLSRGLPLAEADAAIAATGDPDLAPLLRTSMAAVVSQYYADF